MKSNSKFVTSSSRFAPNCEPKNSLRAYYMNLHHNQYKKQEEEFYGRMLLNFEMQQQQHQNAKKNMQRDM